VCGSWDKIIDIEIKSETDFLISLDYVLSKSNCFIMMADSTIFNSQTVKLLILRSSAVNVPVVGISSVYTKAGALISIENNYADLSDQVGSIFKNIVNNNESVSNTKIQKARKNCFSVNIAMAARLGIKIPQEVVKEAFETY
jgi:putative tryptophan/tyrosine transport system substrate-binding protein